MLEEQLIGFLLRGVPEGFLYVFGIYVFSKIKIEKREYIKSSLIIAIVVSCIRLLPIHYGVHTILSMLFIIFLLMFYNKIDPIQVIKSTITTVIIQFLSEGINLLILTNIPNINLDNIFDNIITKSFLGIPSLIITLTILKLFCKFYKKKDEIRDV